MYGTVNVPGTVSALIEAVDLRAGLALRNELRKLRDDADAMLCVLYVVDRGRCETIEYAGDRSVMPVPLPTLECSAPSLDSVRCADLDHHLVVIHAVRIGRGWPSAGLAVVDAGLAPPDVVEGVGAKLEVVLVRALRVAGHR